ASRQAGQAADGAPVGPVPQDPFDTLSWSQGWRIAEEVCSTGAAQATRAGWAAHPAAGPSRRPAPCPAVGQAPRHVDVLARPGRPPILHLPVLPPGWPDVARPSR